MTYSSVNCAIWIKNILILCTLCVPQYKESNKDLGLHQGEVNHDTNFNFGVNYPFQMNTS